MVQGNHIIVFAVDRARHIHRVTIDRQTGRMLQVAAARPDMDFRDAPSINGTPDAPAVTSNPVAAPTAEDPGESWAPPPESKAESVTNHQPANAPPLPRPRPSSASSSTVPASGTVPPARVVLPGGAVPKHERTAGRAYAPAPTPPSSDASGAATSPPPASR
jgi:hypothetical protein